MSQAVKRDPENWQYYYGLAPADASARRDPHAAIRQAQHLNPLDPMVHNLVLNLRGAIKTRWQEAARFPQMPMTLQQ
jgi:hypothetical protein